MSKPPRVQRVFEGVAVSNWDESHLKDNGKVTCRVSSIFAAYEGQRIRVTIEVLE
jgi:hypothetical protein